MTPLEEVRAAHKRLSELRAYSMPGEWVQFEDADVGRSDPLNPDGGLWDFEAASREDAALIVTLHRTIDAQLALLEARIRLAETTQYWQKPDATLEPFSIKPDAQTLALARAINGGTDA